ncbi:FAD-dependent oxidoreductase [Nocardioides humilatus]|uniref:FAD-dependent oxidoreductase n=1 Tax=Nocardioides humilatus TaxID=2607660 RepID=A0A5B1LJQ3_9ACTN|nr:NAD(P)/FAD-dependent oxidoreductase [Nocardioides humilatus]KAA1420965.1 FAD-dependent oxidoreductase [Nocardioides humilatus]
MPELPVVVVGAGLAGLACARDLTRAGRPVVVLEAADRVGGRVATDTIDGFRIDRGFQVLNTAYPALASYVDLDDLRLRRFPRGVRIRRGGALRAVPHPLSSPTAALKAAGSPITGIRGKLALARYAGVLLASSPSSIKDRADVPAHEAWAHLPEQVVRDVLVPFMAGVVLDDEVRTSRVFTDLMMRLFATGHSAVPAAGMQRLPEAIAAQLPPDVVRLEAPVTTVARTSVRLWDGTHVEASEVVVATDPWTAGRLVPDLGPLPSARGVTTYYFAAPAWAGQDGALAVDADGSGVVNSVILTATAPEYGDGRRSLIATSVLQRGEQPRLDAAAAEAVARDLHQAPGAAWELVAQRDISHALPAMPAPLALRKPTWFDERGVWVAGDHRDTSSIQGALVSGGRVARSLLRARAGDSR